MCEQVNRTSQLSMKMLARVLEHSVTMQAMLTRFEDQVSHTLSPMLNVQSRLNILTQLSSRIPRSWRTLLASLLEFAL